MTIKTYLLFMIGAVAVCWAAFGFVVNIVNPEATNWVGFLLFYLSLFLSLSGTIAIIGFIVRFVFMKQELVHDSVLVAFRQSFLIALFAIISLWLLAHDLLNWINILFLIIGLSIMEYFLLLCAKDKKGEVVIVEDENNNNLN